MIPVLDILGGDVVHAVGGRRDEYLPILSELCASAGPLDVAHAFRERFGLTELYVAELDGIDRAEADWDTIGRLSEAGFELWLDAGPETIARPSAARRTILATEWLTDASDIKRAADLHGPERVALGLDVQHGHPQTLVPEWRDRDTVWVAQQAIQLGITSVVLLDVSNVGTSAGPSANTLDLCHQLRASFPAIELVAGGGVRNSADLSAFQAAGADHVLVATALHTGQILKSRQ